MQRAKVAELLAYCADLDKLAVDARNMSGHTATAASGVKVRRINVMRIRKTSKKKGPYGQSV